MPNTWPFLKAACLRPCRQTAERAISHRVEDHVVHLLVLGKVLGRALSSDLGPLSQNPILALVTPFLGGKKVKFPISRQDKDMARHFKDLIESGQFRPVIDRTYPLDQIVEAYKYVESGQKIGNVVISVVPAN